MIQTGTMVTALYKTGKYIGQVVNIKNDKALVEVHAVLKHPDQGDLHQYKQSDVGFFHQRKALAFQEKTWAPLSTVSAYEGEVPLYDHSLQTALTALEDVLKQRGDEWSARSLMCLESLKKEYVSLR
ncbi:kinase-associated protein B [Fictibacillus macauensis ZFHKF-1]|uniref:Kinase-associated protein B n=1 Tax=Fictibacillus macauensis ZFHKF-1 TaxID=1196324 RepID=I8UIT6_9BACL|nr:kinase-associated lipoprotein B [Fictibacillus macauensis]EIT86805.1 kinase-associated protein B [Fictibacillus macauensis ZFHKF-1]